MKKIRRSKERIVCLAVVTESEAGAVLSSSAEYVRWLSNAKPVLEHFTLPSA